MPNITEGPIEVTPSRRATPALATMADEAVSMAVSACELVGWRDLAGELQQVQQQTAGRRRQIERGSTWRNLGHAPGTGVKRIDTLDLHTST